MAKPADMQTALWVIRRLRQAGFDALLAGGCVRDMLLGQTSSDYDVATNATPQQVKKLFRRVLLVGAKFGVAMVLRNRQKVEVTTFRTDLSYSDGRRPDLVRFSTPEEDAQRRDFTINGMFYDPIARKVIDFVGGREDLQRGLVRTIGNPNERFAEDYLRMLRAPRFAVRFGFEIDPATARAVRKYAPNIDSISGERIYDELSKMLAAPTARQALDLLEKLHLAREVLSELFSEPDTRKRALDRVAAVARNGDLPQTLGALLAELPKRKITAIIRRWGASNALRDAVTWLGEHLQDWRIAARLPGLGGDGMRLCEFKRLMANENFRRLRRIWAIEERRQTGSIRESLAIARRAKSIPRRKVSPKPWVMGSDLLQMDLAEGPLVGRIFRELYDAQLDEKFRTKALARKAARDLIEQYTNGEVKPKRRKPRRRRSKTDS